MFIKTWRNFTVLWLILSSSGAMATAMSQTIHEYTLNNGLKLIVKEDHRAPVVFTSIWYKVGGSYEHSGITGVSHLLEHMMFRGTKNYPSGVLDRMVSRVGGQQNAMTSNDFTMYYQLLPAKQLALSFQLEADRMRNLVLSEKDFSKEIQVVMEERRMRFSDNPQALTWERFMAAAHVNNPYHHQTIGWMTDLKNMTDKDALNWYHTWYQPNNAIIVVVGDVKPEDVIKLAQQYFSPTPFKAVPKLKPRTEIPAIGVTRIDVNIPAKVPVLMMGYQTPTLVTLPGLWKPYAIDLMANILGGTDSSRLQNDLLRKRQVVTSIGVDYNPFNLHGNLLQITAIPAAGHTVKEVQHAIQAALKQLQSQPVSAEEMKRVKAQMIAAKIYSRDSVRAQAMVLGLPEVVGLSWKLGQNYNEAVDRVTAEQIQTVAKEIFQDRKLTIAVLKPKVSADKQGAQS